MGNDIKNQYDDLTVYYANELARKYCKFTLEEQKVLHLIFSQINPYGKNPTTFKLNKLDFFD
ncbi:RepB family plasmid replication initiator protein, partial [Borreliella valaisiana]